MSNTAAEVVAFCFVCIIVLICYGIVVSMFYLGWNYGIAPLFDFKEVTWKIAFFITLLLSVIGGFFKNNGKSE